MNRGFFLISVGILLAIELSPLEAGAIEYYKQLTSPENESDSQKTAGFLIQHMSERDRETVDFELLKANHEYALKVRKEFAWSADIPFDIFSQ